MSSNMTAVAPNNTDESHQMARIAGDHCGLGFEFISSAG